MPIGGGCESKLPDQREQQINHNNRDARRDADGQRQDEQKQLAVAQPRQGGERAFSLGGGLLGSADWYDFCHCRAIGESARSGKSSVPPVTLCQRASFARSIAF